MKATIVKINGVEITPELALFIQQRKEEFNWYADVQAEVIDFLIDAMDGGSPQPEVLDKIVKDLLLSVKGVKDSMKRMAKIVSELEIDKITVA